MIGSLNEHFCHHRIISQSTMSGGPVAEGQTIGVDTLLFCFIAKVVFAIQLWFWHSGFV